MARKHREIIGSLLAKISIVGMFAGVGIKAIGFLDRHRYDPTAQFLSSPLEKTPQSPLEIFGLYLMVFWVAILIITIGVILPKPSPEKHS